MVNTHKSLLIKNVRLADTVLRAQTQRDILMKNGVIAEITPFADNDPADGIDVYNAGGRYAVPSFVDMHTHLRDPGFEYKEDIITGTKAALAGGFCAVVSMPNTRPACDSVEIVEQIKTKAQTRGSCFVLPAAAVTKGQSGVELCDYDALSEAGAYAFSDDGNPVSDPSVMREAMRKLAEKDRLIITHAEELALTKTGMVNEGRVAKLMGVAGIPNAAEDAATARDIVLAEEFGCRLHVAHVSTRGSVALIRDAKKRGVRVTAETCPHYFSLCDNDVVFYGVNAKMKPPLRSRKDVAAIIEGLADGTIDCISTDHAPHSKKDKGTSVADGAFGIIGLQTAFCAAYTYLVLPGYIDMYRLVELMSINPARIIGADTPEIGAGIPEVGKRAAITILDIDTDYMFEEKSIVSKSKNSPYIGMMFVGKIDSVVNGSLHHFFK